MTQIIAHRGASAYATENSIEAFKLAVAQGADGIELDVHSTRDGVIIVHHDADVNGQHIAETDWDDLRPYRLPNGESMPTLASVLDTIAHRVILYVEIKGLHPHHDDQLLATLNATPANGARCHVHAFDHRIIKRLLAQQEHLVGGVLSSSYPIDPVRQMRDAGARELWQHVDYLDQSLVDQVHATGGRILAWTVDDEVDAHRMRDLHVDGICTNRPDVTRTYVS